MAIILVKVAIELIMTINRIHLICKSDFSALILRQDHQVVH